MQYQSILAHLAPLLTNQIENVATEALAHLLLQYKVVSDAFREYILQASIGLPEHLNLKTQASWQDAALPDMVGLDNEGRHILVVESKFWAPLTPNQPATYLERLSPDKPAILLFIAPASRLPTLWQELLDCCGPHGLYDQVQKGVTPQFLTLHINIRHVLALTSWESLLAMISQRAQQAEDVYASGDIWQLQSLCARIEAEAFQPLSEDEIISPTEKRISQFRDLIDELVTRLIDARIASVVGYRATPGPDSYKRYMSIHGLPNSDCAWNTIMRTGNNSLKQIYGLW